MFSRIMLLLFMSLRSVPCSGEDWSFSNQVSIIARSQHQKDLAKLSLESTRYRETTKQWSYLPTISASASRQVSVPMQVGQNPSISNALGLSLNMNVFKFGGDWATSSSARSAISAAQLELTMNELAAETNAAKVLCDAIKSQLESEVYKRRMTSNRQAFEAANARYRKGILSEQELVKLKLDASQTEMSLRKSQRVLEQNIEILREWGGEIPTSNPWPLARDHQRYIAAKEWVRNGTSSNFKIQMLQSKADIASNSVAEARSALLPSLDIGWGWTRSAQADFASPVDQQHLVATLTVPIFSRFRDYAEYQSRVHDSAAARTRLELERVTAASDFQNLVKSALAALEDALETENQITIAEQLYRDNSLRFERGLISVNELSIDEHRVLEIEIKAIESWYTAHLSLFQIAEAMGISLTSVAGIL